MMSSFHQGNRTKGSQLFHTTTYYTTTRLHSPHHQPQRGDLPQPRAKRASASAALGQETTNQKESKPSTPPHPTGPSSAHLTPRHTLTLHPTPPQHSTLKQITPLLLKFFCPKSFCPNVPPLPQHRLIVRPGTSSTLRKHGRKSGESLRPTCPLSKARER